MLLCVSARMILFYFYYSSVLYIALPLLCLYTLTALPHYHTPSQSMHQLLGLRSRQLQQPDRQPQAPTAAVRRALPVRARPLHGDPVRGGRLLLRLGHGRHLLL